MRISILTLFPEMFSIFDHSIIGRAREKDLVNLEYYNIRDYSLIDSIKAAKEKNSGKVIFLGPRGKTFNQEMAQELSKEENLIFLCGHYEGIDERAYKHIDMEVSLGDFVLTGGEMAAIPIIDSVLRLIPGVLGKEESFMDESYSDGLLEYPQYTRPEVYEDERVPEVLLSGHHENIRKWRRKQSLLITKERRKDLYKNLQLTKEDIKILKDDRL